MIILNTYKQAEYENAIYFDYRSEGYVCSKSLRSFGSVGQSEFDSVPIAEDSSLFKVMKE